MIELAGAPKVRGKWMIITLSISSSNVNDAVIALIWVNSSRKKPVDMLNYMPSLESM
jgi:hypothetical protein